MSRMPCSLLILVVAAPLISAAPAVDRSPRTLTGWGVVVDPDRDCKIGLAGERLTIEVPATRHDLVETGSVNAPRILRDIEGDFIAQVKVSGNVRHAGGRTSGPYLPYHGAGLILWLDDRNYIRLERAAIVNQDGKPVHYLNFELRKDRKVVDENSGEIPDRDTFLRIERRGRRVLGAVSPDGDRWAYLKPLAADFPKKIKLGVAAINTSNERFKVVFSEPEVYKKDVEEAMPGRLSTGKAR